MWFEKTNPRTYGRACQLCWYVGPNVEEEAECGSGMMWVKSGVDPKLGNALGSGGLVMDEYYYLPQYTRIDLNCLSLEFDHLTTTQSLS